MLFCALAVTACGPQIEVEPLEPLGTNSAPLEPWPTILEHRPTLLDADVVAAGTDVRLADDGAYRQMRLRLWSKRPRRALSGLPEDISGSLFSDRIALSKGEALQAIGEHEAAKEAYVEAIRAGRADAVVEEAVRGLVRVLGRLGEHEARLVYLDALIDNAEQDAPAYEFEIERAESYAVLGRTEEAKGALEALIERYPEPAIAERAESALRAIEKRRRSTRAEARARAIGRIKWHAKNAPPRRALRMIRRASRDVSNDPEILLVKADLLATRGRRWRAQAVLEDLDRRRPAMRPAVALRLARLARDRYQYARGRRAYQALIDEHPGTPESIDAAFEAAAMEYDADDYAAAAEKARAFLADHPSSALVPDAEWLAGFSAFLAGDHHAAEATFETALARKERPRLRYWYGRCLQIANKADEAAASFETITTSEPLTYYGHVAQERLTQLGAPAQIDPLPPVPAPSSVDETIALLGPDRPVGIDRAAALFEGRLRREGTEELLSLAEHYRRTGDTVGATFVLDLFQLFEKDAWVFLLSRQIAQADDKADLKLRPAYWRVWRYAFPTPFASQVEVASKDNDVDPLLIYSVMRTESLFRPYAVSPVGARGLMQLMPATARWIGRRDRRAKAYVRSYRRPASNIWLGAWNLKFLLERFDGDIVRTLAGYNAGPGAVDRWTRRFEGFETDAFVERIPYDETRRYVRRAVESHAVYNKLQ